MIKQLHAKYFSLSQYKFIPCFCLAFAVIINIASVNAQTRNVTNKANVHIDAGTIVSIVDSFTNAVEGSMLNDGHIYIKGDWTNIGSYGSTAGKVSFWGSSLQKIKGSA